MRMTKTRFDTVGIKTAIKKLKFSENSFYRAISEYIWNGFDADATEVCLRYEFSQSKTEGYFRKLSISDNGKGIRYDELGNKFEPLFDSEKLSNGVFERNQSAVHGKLGVGRLTFFTFAHFAEWDTVFVKDEQKFGYNIKISAEKLDDFTPEEEIKKTSDPTGTKVTFSGFVQIKGEDNFESRLLNYLRREFSWFLELNLTRKFNLLINGKPIDYSSLIADKDELQCKHEESGEKFSIHYVRWTDELNQEYSNFYFLDENSKERWKETTKLNNQGDKFYHSVFITSSYFNNFNFKSSETSSQKTIRGGVRSDAPFQYLVRQIDSFLKKHRKPFLKKHSNKVYAEFREEGIITTDNKDPAKIIEAKEFENVFKELYGLQPKFFTNLKKEQKKIFVGLLQLLLKSDERDELLDIIGNIIDLDKKDREDFRRLIELHPLRSIVKTMKVISDRLKTVEILKQLVFRKDLKANERKHLQKVVEENYWLFGEQYHLISKDEGFQKSLERYLHLLRGENGAQFSGNKRERTDIFLCQRLNESKRIRNVIVELKSPKIKKLTSKEYLQVQKYKNAVLEDPQFNSEIADWEFLLIGQSTDEFIDGQIASNKNHGEPCLANKVKNSKIFVKTWSHIFDEFTISHNWLNKKLEVQKEKVVERLSSADEGVKEALAMSAARS